MDLMWSEGRFLFAGADTRAFTASSPIGSVTWGLRLSPGAARALLDIPACELTDQRFDLSELIKLPAAVVDAGPGQSRRGVGAPLRYTLGANSARAIGPATCRIVGQSREGRSEC